MFRTKSFKRRTVAYVITACMILSLAGSFAYAWTTNVSDAAKKAALSSKKLSVNVGSKKLIKIKFKNKKATYKFNSKNKNICKADKKGFVTGKKAGKANVLVRETLNKKTRSLGVVKVTVKAAEKAQDTTQNGTQNQGTTNNQTNQGTTPNNQGTQPDPNVGTATQAPVEPTAVPEPTATPDPYDVELFALTVEDGKVETVDGNTCTVDMQFFTGTAIGEWFSGRVLVDGNIPGCDVIKTYKETDEVVHHARYILDGTDILGNNCRIFVEDVSIGQTDDYVITKPIFITNSSLMGFLESADLQGRMVDNGDGTKTITYYRNGSVTDPLPFREVHMPDDGSKYTKELFTFNISVGGSVGVNGANGNATMIHFGGSSNCANFKGNIVMSDADTRLQYTGTIQTLSARYILSGTRADGTTPMRIYVENNGIDNNGMVTEPTIITDNPDFEYIEKETLHGTVSWETGLTIHMWATH